MNILFERFTLPEQLSRVIYNSPSVIIPTSKEVLFELIFGNEYTGKIEVLYDIHGKAVKEAGGRPLQKRRGGELSRGLHAQERP